MSGSGFRFSGSGHGVTDFTSTDARGVLSEPNEGDIKGHEAERICRGQWIDTTRNTEAEDDVRISMWSTIE